MCLEQYPDFCCTTNFDLYVVSAPSCVRSCLMLLQSCSVRDSLRPTSERAHCCSSVCFPGSCVHSRDVMKERSRGSHQKHNSRAFSQQRWSFITVDCKTHSYKNPMHYFWKRGTHSGWCRRCCHSTRMTESFSFSFAALKEAQRLLNHVQTLVHWYVTKTQTHFNIINVSQCRNNTNSKVRILYIQWKNFWWNIPNDVFAQHSASLW